MTSKIIYTRLLYCLITILFVVGLGYLLVAKFDFFNLLSELSVQQIEKKYIFFFIAILLVVPNWGLEAQKWKLVMNEYVPISFLLSLKSILAGITVGLFTPAKVGEYAGRMMFVSQEDKAASGVATLLNSMAQMIVTICLGTISFVGLAYNLDLLQLDVSQIVFAVVVTLMFIFLGFAFFPQIIALLSRLSFLKKHLVKIQAIDVPKSTLFSVLTLSIIRYTVYAIQYLFIIYFLGVEYCMVELLGYISIIFLLQSILPLPPVAALIGRSGLAILIFSNLGISELIILCATLLLWVINLVVPALFGLAIVIKHRIQTTI